MDVRTTLEPLLKDLPDDSLRQLIEFAAIPGLAGGAKKLATIRETQLARAYGHDEPDYSESDIKPEHDA